MLPYLIAELGQGVALLVGAILCLGTCGYCTYLVLRKNVDCVLAIPAIISGGGGIACLVCSIIQFTSAWSDALSRM